MKSLKKNEAAKHYNHQWSWSDTKYELAEFILEKLENYKDRYNKDGYAIPHWVVDSYEENSNYSEDDIQYLKECWNQEIDEMILTFKQILNYTLGFDEKLGYDEGKIQKGLDKFAKYYLHFWD